MTPMMTKRMDHVLRCKELVESIAFYKDQTNRMILQRQRGVSGAGLKSLSIDKAIVTLTNVDKRLTAALKTAETGDFGEYMKIADWQEANQRQLEQLKVSQRKKVNVFEFSYELMDAIKDRVTLVDMVDELKIRKKRSGGGRYVILCPFHDEKTPSCMIYVNQDKYHCFSCQAQGDVIDFYQNFLEIEFDEALARLCDRLNVQVMDADQVERADQMIDAYRGMVRTLEQRLATEKHNYAKEIANANHN